MTLDNLDLQDPWEKLEFLVLKDQEDPLEKQVSLAYLAKMVILEFLVKEDLLESMDLQVQL